MRLLPALSHLALWPGLYAASAVLYTLHITSQPRLTPPIALAFLMAFLTGTGTYLLDRVKIRDAWLDPADREAHPARFAFIANHARAIRCTAAILLILAAITPLLYNSLAPIHHQPQRWLIAIPFLSGLGVVLYAARPRRSRPRVKDVLLIKNSYVAAGLTGFAVLMSQGWTFTTLDPTLLARPIWIWAAITLFLRVFADAIVCDLDDQPADARYGTATLPTVIGRAHAWNTATAIRLALAASLAFIPIGSPAARIAWTAATAISTIAMRLARPRQLRDWVDARFAIEAVAVTLLLLILPALVPSPMWG